MKIKFLILLAALLCCKTPSLLCQEQKTNAPSDRVITLEDYCTFLNAEQAVDRRLQATGSEKATNHSDRFLGTITASNLNDFYDERMLDAFIMRTGLPGNYCYNLISKASADSFNSCITGLSWDDAEQYCNWCNNAASTFNLNSCAIGAANVDPFLKSNQLTFRLVNTGATVYQSGGPEVVETAGAEEVGVEVAATLAWIVSMVEGGTRSPEAARADDLSSRASYLTKASLEEDLVSAEEIQENTTQLLNPTSKNRSPGRPFKIWSDEEIGKRQKTVNRLEQERNQYAIGSYERIEKQKALSNARSNLTYGQLRLQEAIAHNRSSYNFQKKQKAECQKTTPSLAPIGLLDPREMGGEEKNYEVVAARDKSTEALGKPLIQGDEDAAKLHEKIVLAKWGATKGFENSAKNKKEENFEASAAWLKSAEAFKEQEKALLEGDEDAAEDWGHIALGQKDFALEYEAIVKRKKSRTSVSKEPLEEKLISDIRSITETNPASVLESKLDEETQRRADWASEQQTLLEKPAASVPLERERQGFYRSDEIQQYIRNFLRKAAARNLEVETLPTSKAESDDDLSLAQETEKTMALAQALKPPLGSTQPLNWEAWAEKIIHQANYLSPDTSLKEVIAQHGIAHSEWVDDEFKAAWALRMKESAAIEKKTSNEKDPIESKRTETLAEADRRAWEILVFGRPLKASEITQASFKTLIEIKAEFAIAKSVWDDFSKAKKLFEQDRSIENLRFAVTTESAFTSILTAAAADTRFANNTAVFAATAANEAYSAAYNYASAVADACAPLADAVADARPLATAARYHAKRTVGTFLEKEAQWAAMAAQEAVDFAKTISDFYDTQRGGKGVVAGISMSKQSAEESPLSQKIKQQEEQIVNYQQKMNEANATRDQGAKERFQKALQLAEGSLQRLKELEDWKIKFVETTAGQSKYDLSAFWDRIVVQNNSLAEQYQKGAMAFEQGNETEMNKWEKAFYHLEESTFWVTQAAFHMTKILEAEKDGYPDLVTCYQETATQNLLTAQQWSHLAATTIAQDGADLEKLRENAASDNLKFYELKKKQDTERQKIAALLAQEGKLDPKKMVEEEENQKAPLASPLILPEETLYGTTSEEELQTLQLHQQIEFDQRSTAFGHERAAELFENVRDILPAEEEKKTEEEIDGGAKQEPIIQENAARTADQTLLPSIGARTRGANDPLPLRKFITAIKNNPSATRLVLQGEGENLSLVASHSWDPRKIFWNSRRDKEENKRLAIMLKDALYEAYEDKGASITGFIDEFFLDGNTAHWSAAKINNIIQTVGEKAEPSIAPLSEIDAERYPSARVIAKMENAQKRVRILKTQLNNPYIRIEEELDSDGKITNRQWMAANYISVLLPSGKDSADFQQELKLRSPHLASLETWMEQFLPDIPFYKFYFKSNSMECFHQVLEAIKELGITAGPDFISVRIHTANDPLYEKNQWNLHGPYGINAPKAWKNSTQKASSAASIVAVIDTGIYDAHEDLKNNMCKPKNTLPMYGCSLVDDMTSTEDKNGHGTHCAGIIGAVRNNKRGIAGIASNIRLMPCKVSDNEEFTNKDYITSSLLYLISKGVKLANCSLGEVLEKNKDQYTPEHSLPMLKALEDASNQEVIFVVAAGNDNNNNDISNPYPACYAKTTEENSEKFDNIVVVAATDEEGQLAKSFPSGKGSNYGKTTVHLAAPGTGIWSTFIRKEPTWGLFRTKNNAYAPLSGTSMAAPHVTAALALMRQEFPLASAKELIDRLLATTDPIPSFKKDKNNVEIKDGNVEINQHTIAGRLNLAHALRKDLLGIFGDFPGCMHPLTREQQASHLTSQQAITLRSKAEEAAIITDFIWGNTPATAVQCQQTKDAWTEALTQCQESLKQAPENFKPWWQQELDYAEQENTRWVNKLTELEKLLRHHPCK